MIRSIILQTDKEKMENDGTNHELTVHERQEKNEHRKFNDSTLEFADEMWFHILSYLRKRDGCVGCQESLGGIFRSIGLLSKHHRACTVRYVQFVPQYFRYDFRRIPKLLWASGVGMNLEGIDFWGVTSRPGIEYKLCLHMLRECCITNLRYFGISMVRDPVRSIMNNIHRVQSMFPDIPSEVLDRPMSFLEFQREFAHYVATQSKTLERMYISFDKDQIHLPLLTNFTNSLVSLSLGICGDSSLARVAHTSTESGTLDRGLERITEAIECMCTLKILRITSNLKASFRIRSNSLQVISTSHSSQSFWVDECVCPSLESFKCVYFVDSEISNGVKPMFDVTDEDRLTPFLVGSYPFLGMYVPPSCAVYLAW